MTRAVGYLAVNDIEVINNNRTATYVTQFNESGWNISSCANCRCDVTDDNVIPDATPYTTPDDEDGNPAPWWTPDCDPAATGFWGAVISTFDISSGRSTNRSSGSQTRRQFVTPDTREITIEAALFGTDAGRRFGRHWLTSQLSKARCCPGVDCPPSVMGETLLACDEGEFWSLPNLELVSIEDSDTGADEDECDSESVTITMQCDPYIWRYSNDCEISGAWQEYGDVDETAIRRAELCDFACCSGGPICIGDETPECVTPTGRKIERSFPAPSCFCMPWFSSRRTCHLPNLCVADRYGFGLILEAPTDDVYNLEVYVWADLGAGDPADNTTPATSPRQSYICTDPCFHLQVSYIPAGSSLIIDGRRTRPSVTLECEDGDLDGRHLVAFPSGMTPVTLDGASAVWVAVDQNAERVADLTASVFLWAGTEG